VPHSVILNFTRQSTVGPHEVPELEVGERPPSMLRNINGGPPGGALELEVKECTPSTLRNIDGGPPGGAGGRSGSGHHQS
jgi:hypothetical protein